MHRSFPESRFVQKDNEAKREWMGERPTWGESKSGKREEKDLRQEQRNLTYTTIFLGLSMSEKLKVFSLRVKFEYIICGKQKNGCLKMFKC